LDKPTFGVRYVVDYVDGEGTAEARYHGMAHLPEGSIAIDLKVAPGGVKAELAASPLLSPERRRELEKEAAALVRSATKSAIASGAVLPRRIARWRHRSEQSEESGKIIDPAGGT
jgi:hypothetical protein